MSHSNRVCLTNSLESNVQAAEEIGVLYTDIATACVHPGGVEDELRCDHARCAVACTILSLFEDVATPAGMTWSSPEALSVSGESSVFILCTAKLASSAFVCSLLPN